MNMKEVEKPDVIDDLLGLQLVYDVWIAGLYVGRVARRFGLPCIKRDKSVNMMLATEQLNEHTYKLVQI